MTLFFASLPITFLLASCSPQEQQKNGCARRLEVCVSPGCLADGAQATFRKLAALAPPNSNGVQLIAGGCQSACGMGPVILEEHLLTTIENSQPKVEKKVIHKRVTKDKTEMLVKLLLGIEEQEQEQKSQSSMIIHPDLIKGYELCEQGDDAFQKKKFQDAIPLYEQGIQLASPHITEKDLSGKDNLDTKVQTQTESNIQTPPHVKWLVQTYTSDARSKLALKNLDGALESAIKACDRSHQSDPMCLELLAEIYKEQKKPNEERMALQTMFGLVPDETKLPRDVANRWREWGFRLAKLEREAV